MVKLLNAFLFFPSKKEYLAKYADNETAKKVATKLWNSLDSQSWYLLLIMIAITIIVALLYFFPFNNRPGRHYLPKYWCSFGLGALFATFFATIIECHIAVNNVGFDYSLLFNVAITNALYAFIIYVIISFLIFRSGRSNAYPYF